MTETNDMNVLLTDAGLPLDHPKDSADELMEKAPKPGPSKKEARRRRRPPRYEKGHDYGQEMLQL